MGSAKPTGKAQTECRWRARPPPWRSDAKLFPRSGTTACETDGKQNVQAAQLVDEPWNETGERLFKWRATSRNPRQGFGEIAYGVNCHRVISTLNHSRLTLTVVRIPMRRSRWVSQTTKSADMSRTLFRSRKGGPGYRRKAQGRGGGWTP